MSKNPDRRGQFKTTAIDPRVIVKAAFSASRPQGLGMLHHRPDDLTEAELDTVMAIYRRDGTIRIDYLRGRSMKFDLFYDAETADFYFDLDWYDHGRHAAEQLMRNVDLPDVDRAIEEARAGKKAIKEEREARHIAAAKTALGLVADGNAKAPEFFWKRQPDDPIYQAWAYGADLAVDKGWLIVGADHLSFAVTVEGHEAMKAHRLSGEAPAIVETEQAHGS